METLYVLLSCSVKLKAALKIKSINILKKSVELKIILRILNKTYFWNTINHMEEKELFN